MVMSTSVVSTVTHQIGKQYTEILRRPELFEKNGGFRTPSPGSESISGALPVKHGATQADTGC